jgi:hypothetical protein
VLFGRENIAHTAALCASQAMAERSVDGKVDLEYAPSGVTWRLTCAAGNALEKRERSPNFEKRENPN